MQIIDSCQTYEDGVLMSCSPEELAIILEMISVPAGYVSNVTVRDGGDGSVPRWEKIKRELAAYPEQEHIINRNFLSYCSRLTQKGLL